MLCLKNALLLATKTFLVASILQKEVARRRLLNNLLVKRAHFKFKITIAKNNTAYWCIPAGEGQKYFFL